MKARHSSSLLIWHGPLIKQWKQGIVAHYWFDTCWSYPPLCGCEMQYSRMVYLGVIGLASSRPGTAMYHGSSLQMVYFDSGLLLLTHALSYHIGLLWINQETKSKWESNNCVCLNHGSFTPTIALWNQLACENSCNLKSLKDMYKVFKISGGWCVHVLKLYW